MSERIGESLGIGLGVSEIGELVLQFTALLPSESGAEKRERFSGTGRGLEERVTVVLSLGSIQCRDDPTHERELRPVRLVREFDLDASNVVHIFRALDAWVWTWRSWGCRDHFCVCCVVVRVGL